VAVFIVVNKGQHPHEMVQSHLSGIVYLSSSIMKK